MDRRHKHVGATTTPNGCPTYINKLKLRSSDDSRNCTLLHVVKQQSSPATYGLVAAVVFSHSQSLPTVGVHWHRCSTGTLIAHRQRGSCPEPRLSVPIARQNTERKAWVFGAFSPTFQELEAQNNWLFSDGFTALTNISSVLPAL